MIEIPEAGLKDITTTRLRDRQTWMDLIGAFDEVIIANVDDPIAQLEMMRFLPPDADSAIAAEVCRMLGFDLSQDVLNMSIDKFNKLATQLGMYPDTNGTDNFTKFISLMTNGNCEVTYLWTDDYVNFYDTPLGIKLEDGGTWFKTTHVDLSMGFSTLSGLQLKSNQTLGQRVVDIFYQQAPACLVIQRQTFTVSMDTQELGFAAKLLGFERVYELECSGSNLP